MTSDSHDIPSRSLHRQGWRLFFVYIPIALVSLSIVLGWFVAFRYKTALEEAVIASWQQTQLEVVRAVARSVTLYVNDHHSNTPQVQIEQQILKQFVAPVKLLQNGDAWIYAPDHVVFDLSSDFPEAYRGRSMTDIFQFQKDSGAAHYEAMCEDVANAREGHGWYIWLPEKGVEIAAWSPVSFGSYIWTIGLSTPLNEILQATGAAAQNAVIFIVMGIASILGTAFMVVCIVGAIRHHRQDTQEKENHLRLQKVVADMQGEVERRKRTETRLRQLNSRFNTLIQAIPDSVYLKDSSGQFLVVNHSFERLVGRKSSEILGHENEIGLLPDWFGRNPQVEQRVLAQGTIQCFSEKGVGGGAGERYLDVVVSPVKDDSEQVAGLVGMIRDVTDIRLAELEQERLREQLAQLQKMEAIGTLAGGVAHDLNNILAGLVSYPELLIMSLPPDSPLKKPLETMQRSGQMAADIVHDLLILARRGGRDKTIIDLNTLIQEYAASPVHQKLALERSGVAFRLDLADDLLLIAGTVSDLSKTVMNLVINAFEAIHGSGEVTVSTENWYVDGRQTALTDIGEGEYVRVCVRDSGEGIPPELQSRIFEPFFSKKALHRSGSGLGLAVVWGTMQDHGGHVNVLSTPGRGSCFELYFPVSREVLVRKKLDTPQEALSGAGHTVLVVDDVPMQREIASAMLTRLGYQVSAVESGEAAIAFVREQPVDLLILDMIMEGIDGLETFREILAFYPEQKAVIVSGFSEPGRIEEARRLGCAGYIKKPYLIETLARAVWAALNRGAEGD